MNKLFVILAAFVFIGGGFVWSFLSISEGRAIAVGNVEKGEIAAMEAQILASTVQIEMFDNGRIEGNQRHIQTSRGFGTIVQYEDQHFILTHNHWSIPSAELSRTEIRNAEGILLLILEGPNFYSLTRYQDDGTMLLDAPVGLNGVSAAELGDGTAIPAGSTAWLATFGTKSGQGIQIETALVREVDGTAVPGLLLLEGRETAVISGDSGGGVWTNGQLVGNLWMIQVAEKTWGLGFSLNRPTGSIVAGMQPLPGAAGVTPADLTTETAVNGGFERGIQP